MEKIEGGLAAPPISMVVTALRFAIPLMAVIAILGFCLSPAMQLVSEHWIQRDLDQRSQLLFDSLHAPVERLLDEHDTARIDQLFSDISRDDNVVAFGICDGKGLVTVASQRFPGDFDCATAAGHDRPPSSRLDDKKGGLGLVTAFPLTNAADSAKLIILHGASDVGKRVGQVQFYMELYMAALALATVITAVYAARWTLRSWERSMRTGLMSGPEANPTGGGWSPEIAPIVRDIKQMLRDIDDSRREADDSRIEWTPNTLKLILEHDLPATEILVVSNREPYIHIQEDDRVLLQTPASGLVSALEPIMVACGGTWIAHGGGSADRSTVDENDRLAVPPDKPAYRLRRVWLSDEETDGYYYGFANEGLWPLCHLAYIRPIFRDEDWQHYVAVNRKFADAVIAEATSEDPIVLVQDYHFALLAQMVKESLPNATIVTFWHIPWPNAEAFSICPEREAVLRGMLGSTIMGFHTQFHCNNFMETVDRFLESRIDRERMSITCQGVETLVRPYPISIDWPPKALACQRPVETCREDVCRRFGLPTDLRLAVGVERFDYTKGILDRMHAVDLLLETHPDWRGRFTLLQAVAPTREKLSNYSGLREEAMALCQEINDRHGGEVPAILLSIRHHDIEEVYELYRAADLCVVSSLHDGMNLVAKEFVAARDDEQGVLVLSTFAGAARELPEALIVNPYDHRDMALAFEQAFAMPPEEQKERMGLMRTRVREHNVYRWAGHLLLDVARMRQQHRLNSLVPLADD